MFCCVDPQHAGPSAVGVLIPRGAKTLVIVRPRALTIDLLPARWDGDTNHAPEFCGFTRDEAAGVASRFIEALETAVAIGVNPVQTFGDAKHAVLQIWLRTDEFVWIVCRRMPGQAYRPAIYGTQTEAAAEAEQMARFVWPAADARQEYYFNTQGFS